MQNFKSVVAMVIECYNQLLHCNLCRYGNVLVFQEIKGLMKEFFVTLPRGSPVCMDNFGSIVHIVYMF